MMERKRSFTAVGLINRKLPGTTVALQDLRRRLFSREVDRYFRTRYETQVTFSQVFKFRRSTQKRSDLSICRTRRAPPFLFESDERLQQKRPIVFLVKTLISLPLMVQW